MELIIARYGEIHLKGGNRDHFIARLVKNLRARIAERGQVALKDSRIVVTDFTASDKADIVKTVCNTFGITSASVVAQVESTQESILKHLSALRVSGSFKIEVKRADKSFPVQSLQFAATCGGVICDNNISAVVDVHTPNTTIFIDVRRGDSYIYDNIHDGVGGLPIGVGGRCLVLLSGGIDSPVAAYCAAQRGMAVDFVHFATPPYTSDFALEKVVRLQKTLEYFTGKSRLFVVPFTEISREIQKNCDAAYMITVMRRFMVRIAERIGIANGHDAIFTGENLGQVASQTIEGITTNNFCATRLPILRPLITLDKADIINIARRIGTYEISCEPHEDCCTVFVPKSPVTRPKREKAEAEEARLNVDILVENAIKDIT